MRLVSFDRDGESAIGILDGEIVVDLSVADPGLPHDMKSFIALGAVGCDRAQTAAEGASDAARMPLSDVQLRPVVPDPSKIVCLGLNYAEHAAEGGNEVPDYPALFMRASNSLLAAGDPIVCPRCAHTLDFEAELMIVVGARARHVGEARALDHVFGYTAFNDGSVREYQRKTSQWTAGKNFDATGPAGPAIVTADELPPGAAGLRIQSRLNGQVMQDSNTENMIFPVPRIIAILSEFMTLEPGDLIATGTPRGVGYARTPPVWMKPGDTIEVDIEGIGVLVNPVVAELPEERVAAAE